MDVALSAFGLVLLAPLLVVIAIAVRLDSPGPVLFRQQRVARGGRLFELLKFRSMRCDQGNGRLITVSGDDRITRVGALLRRNKLDELPQLINVIKGDMSLVGPRPEVPKYVALYPPADRDLVLSVRPGITDSASVEFYDEGQLLAASADPEKTYVEEILPRKLALYGAYVKGRSTLGDILILGRTLARILGLGAKPPAH
jgi:lipopolysaccharide/colanic/teichoic acid biosynthesis glycosyltransferase